MSSKAYFVASGTIFGLVAVAHLVRVVCQMRVHVGDWAFPVWASWGGFVAAGVLCLWAFRLLWR
ncbi:MAG: hypothetical protein ABSG68_22845 [Thermoguttaceae bacterium]|jgi:hypothetical protein